MRSYDTGLEAHKCDRATPFPRPATVPRTRWEDHTASPHPKSLHFYTSYDNVGNQATITDAKSQVITFTYNAANQLTTRTYPDASTVTFTYSDVGLRT